jgi:uncharacterized protein Yka (UPF0111/DUF47 family)
LKLIKSIRGIFDIGEKKTFSEISEMIEIGRKANYITIEMLDKLSAKEPPPSSSLLMSSSSSSSTPTSSSSSSSSTPPLTALNEDIRLLERQSDEISFKIKDSIVTEGAVNPNVIDNLLGCVELADSIVNNYYAVSKEINRVSTVRFDEDSFMEQAPKMNALFLESLNLAEQAMKILIKILNTANLSEITKLRVEIQQLEQKGDKVKNDGFDILYMAAPSIHYLQFIHYSELLHKFDDILDSCEDLTDRLLSIVTSISK